LSRSASLLVRRLPDDHRRQILADAKVNSGSFYRFFRTKESVLLAVLANNASSSVPEVVTPAFQKVADPLDRVLEILNHYRDDLINSKFGPGCLLGKLAFEIPEPQPRIHQRIAIGFDTRTAAVAKCLEDARGDLPNEIDLKALSIFILAVMEGAVAQARAHQSIAPFDTAVQQLLHHFALLHAQRDCEDEKSELLQTQTQKTHSLAKQEKRTAIVGRNARKRHVVPARLRDLTYWGNIWFGELCAAARS
jgi:TetR/AcrR family transcriptional regulator, transcriptional repressor for nem operon